MKNFDEMWEVMIYSYYLQTTRSISEILEEFDYEVYDVFQREFENYTTKYEKAMAKVAVMEALMNKYISNSSYWNNLVANINDIKPLKSLNETEVFRNMVGEDSFGLILFYINEPIYQSFVEMCAKAEVSAGGF